MLAGLMFSSLLKVVLKGESIFLVEKILSGFLVSTFKLFLESPALNFIIAFMLVKFGADEVA